jgi:uracil-DNA glycosylase
MTDLTRGDMEAWLGWYEAVGADVWCAEEPADWAALRPADARAAGASPAPLDKRPGPAGPMPPAVQNERPPRHAVQAEASRPAPAKPPALSRPMAPADAPPPGTGLAGVESYPATSLEALQAAIAEFDGCPLKATAKNLCFYRGVPQADLMIIGEAPGRDEDLAGKPFVGAAGQLLDRMLASIGRSEADVHITNVVYWRPPGNRVPTPFEVRACLPFLLRQVELVAPKLILTLGAVAAHNLLGVETGITKLRGKMQTLPVGGRDVPLLPSLHPAYLLRTPIAKRQVWADLLAAQVALAGAS